jgi:hypothetical protein
MPVIETGYKSSYNRPMPKRNLKDSRKGFGASASRIGNRSVNYNRTGSSTPTISKGGKRNPKLKEMRD